MLSSEAIESKLSLALPLLTRMHRNKDFLREKQNGGSCIMCNVTLDLEQH